MLQTQSLENVLNCFSQGIFFVEKNGLITTFNTAAASIFGYPQEEILQTSFWDHFKDESLGFSMKEALKAEQPIPPIHISLNSKEIEIEASYNEGLIILLRDVTELRKLQNLAQRNHRLKELGEMAAMVAHEIRNPLGGIKGFAALLHRDLKDKPELQQMAAYIVEGTENLDQLITHILNYAHPLDPKFELVDLVPLLSDIIVIIDANPEFGKKYIVNITSSHEHLFAWVDPHLLKSAVLNLVVNGCQAMPSGGHVFIDLFLQGKTCLITVTDQGEGISEENQTKLFRPFFTTKAKGNGFGLAEVLKVVQAHDGEIDVESQVGVGTTFSIKLPNKVSHGH